MATEFWEATQIALQTGESPLVRKPKLTEQYLKKPPFRFLHDIVTEVTKQTGFAQGLYTDEELVSTNIKDKDAKVGYLNKIINCVGIALNSHVPARSLKIVAGLEPENTNVFLQMLAAAAVQGGGASQGAVQKVLAGEPMPPAGRGDPQWNQRLADFQHPSGAPAQKAPAAQPSQPAQPPPPAKQPPAAQQSTPAKQPPQQAAPAKQAPPAQPAPPKAEPPAASATPASKPPDSEAQSQMTPQPPQRPPSAKPAPRPSPAPPETATPAPVEAAQVAATPRGSTPGAPTAKTGAAAPPPKTATPPLPSAQTSQPPAPSPALEQQPAPLTARGSSPAARRSSRTARAEAEAAAASSSPDTGTRPPRRESGAKEAPHSEPPTRPPVPTAGGAMPPMPPQQQRDDAPPPIGSSHKEDSHDSEPPSVLGNGNAGAPVAGLRPGTAAGLRPQSARRGPPKLPSNVVSPDKKPPDVKAAIPERPPSARPGGREAPLPPAAAPRPGVILGEGTKEEDDQETVAVVLDPQTLPEGTAVTSEGAGKLVRDILETKKDFQGREEEGVKDGPQGTGILLGRGRRPSFKKEEGPTKKEEIQKLRESVQTLCHNTNPLGKCMDYLQEDIENMHKEFNFWRNEKQMYTARLEEEQRQTEEMLQEGARKLMQLDEEIRNEQARINSTKAQVLRNDEIIEGLIRMVVSGGIK